MKKLTSLALAIIMMFSLAACGGKEDDNKTVSAALVAQFTEIVKENGSMTAEEIAGKLAQNKAVEPISPMAMPIEPGFLMGFDNVEVTEFKSGAMFAPMIGTIPFVGYIFVLNDGVDVEEFKTTLKDNADLRWNICTQADEMIVAHEGSIVFFLMSPKSFEQPETDNTETGEIQIPVA